MVFAPVGIRCPEHAGGPQGTARVTTGVKRAAFEGTGAIVTKALIAANVLVFLVNLAQGSTLNQISGSFFEKGALYIQGGLDQGEWWRLITTAFLHGSLIHLGMNMLMLWIVGAPVEQAIGRGRFLALYVISGLAGSAGALLLSPDAITVGASGAIYGVLGAALVLERQGSYVLGGQAFGLIAINLISRSPSRVHLRRRPPRRPCRRCAQHARALAVRQDARDLRPPRPPRHPRARRRRGREAWPSRYCARPGRHVRPGQPPAATACVTPDSASAACAAASRASGTRYGEQET